MKKMIVVVFYLCVALLPTHILGDVSLIKVLDKMAKNGTTINDIFRPTENGYLGKGFPSIVYKGTLLLTPQMEVAMKFTHFVHEKSALHEYGIYTRLGAINNTRANAYGIPQVSYFGAWENYFLMAITLFHSEFEKRCHKQQLTETDILIVCREFVRISKYIHSHGIYHGDLRLKNLMFRYDRGFVIDYDRAEILYEDEIRKTFTDWASFMRELQIVAETDNKIDKSKLKKIFSEFSRTISSNNHRKPNYDKLYKVIDQQIKGIHKGEQPVFVSWLTPEQKQMAICQSTQKPIPDIHCITQPSDKDAFHGPEINYNYFLHAATSSKGDTSLNLNADPDSIEDLDLDLHLGRR